MVLKRRKHRSQDDIEQVKARQQNQSSVPSSSQPKTTKSPSITTLDEFTITAKSLSHTGLRTPLAVETFLKTAGGLGFLAKIGQLLNLEKAIQDRNQEYQLEYQLHKQRLKTALLLWLLAKDASASDKIKKEIEEDILEKLARLKEKPSNTSQKSKEAELIAAQIAFYLKAIEEMEELERRLAKTEASLESDIKTIKQQQAQINKKYQDYRQSFKKADEIIENSAKNPEEQEAELEAEIKSLTREGDLLAQQVMHAVEANEDHTVFMQQHHSVVLAIVAVKEFLNSIKQKGAYLYYNQAGDPVADREHAHFAIPIKDIQLPGKRGIEGLQLIKDEQGKLYLLKAGQKWDEVKDNPAQKEKAAADFRRLEPQIMVVKKLVDRNEIIENHLKSEELEQKSQGLRAVKMQRQDANNSISHYKNALQAIRPATPVAQQRTASIAPSAPTGLGIFQPLPSPSTLSFKDRLTQLRNAHQPLTKDMLQALISMPETNPATQRLLQQAITQIKQNPILFAKQTATDDFLRQLSLAADENSSSLSPFQTTPQPSK